MRTLPYLFANAHPWHYGEMAEWSKALVLGTSPSGGVGSNPTLINPFEGFSFIRVIVSCYLLLECLLYVENFFNKSLEMKFHVKITE
uniref:Uncharacterized protein n=1 Tax=Caenorhabditis tropicalis TaxID=1561998 RepID=A0A1I7T5Q5_9PELO